MSTAAPNAATIAVPAMSCRRDPNVSDRLLGSGGWKASSSPIGARGGAAQSSAGGPSLSSAKLSLLGRTSVRSTVAMLPPIFHPRFPLCRIEGGPAPKSKPSSICRKDGDRKTAERHSNGLLLASFLNFGEWPRQRADSNIRSPCGICSWKCRITPRLSRDRDRQHVAVCCHKLDDVSGSCRSSVTLITREACLNAKTRRSRRSVMPYPSPRGRAGRRRTALTRLGGGE